MGTSFEKAVMGSAAYEIERPPLVGEMLVRSPDPTAAVRGLAAVARTPR